MIAALALALLVDTRTATSAGRCADAEVQAAVGRAAEALGRKNAAVARTEITPASDCPVRSGPTYAAHVLAADLAVGEGDWARARALLAGVDVHPESGLSARAGFIRLRADQGLGDAAAFTADRDRLLAADDAALAAAGRRMETFRVGAAKVTAYQAVVDQGQFRREMEFIVIPDDPAAYPASILLTDDRGAASLGLSLGEPGKPAPEHVWFVDSYTCPSHATLAPPAQPLGPRPAYADVKARVVAALADGRAAAVREGPERAACFTSAWLLPGLGLHR